MRSVLLFVILAVLAIALAWSVAGLTGTVAITVGSYAVETSTPVALTLATIAFLILYLLVRGIGLLFSAPQRLRRANARRRQAVGDRAVTRALVALAANDSDRAQKEAARSRRLLGSTPLTLLLHGQAFRQAGRDTDAEAAFQQLILTKGGSFLGQRGLLQIASSKGDWEAANAAALSAEAAYPGNAWVRQQRKQLALRTGAYRDALRLAGDDDRAGLAIAAADAEADEAEALRLAKQAFQADPALAPAALAYATRLRKAGKDKAALDVLRRAWVKQPHPDLAAEAMAPVTDKLKRMGAAKALAHANPSHPESMLLLAQASLDAGLTAEARTHAAEAQKTGLNQRRLWVLMAEIAEQDGQGTEAQEAWRRASTAEPDPVWRCGQCGTVQSAWHLVCPACSTSGKVAWVQPDSQGAASMPPSGAPSGAPLGAPFSPAMIEGITG